MINNENRADHNRTLVTQAFAEFAAGNTEILRTVLAEDFIEHNPSNPSGRDDFTEFAASTLAGRGSFDLRRVIADEQFVALHYRLTPHDPADGPACDVVDIWRVEDDHIVEHWDVVQPLADPAEAPNRVF